MIEKYNKDISIYDNVFLFRSIKKRCIGLSNMKINDYLDFLSSNKDEAYSFFNSLNIIYSQFFRDPLTFALLEQWILPMLINNKSDCGKIRIWSAGCAYGQEAYSISMILDDLLLSNGYKNMRYRIFATDISHAAIDIARIGVFHKDSLSNVKLKYIDKYFTKHKEGYIIDEHLKRSVSFSVYDLTDDSLTHPPESIYGDFDIVFCSNLLLYYKPETKKAIVDKLYKSLTKTGLLVTGDAECSFFEQSLDWKMFSSPIPIFQRVTHD